MMLFKDRFYIPTQSNLDLLRRLYPSDDPYQPAWHQIKADLIVAGQETGMLTRSEAPLLLKLLQRTVGASRPAPPAAPPTASSAEPARHEAAGALQVDGQQQDEQVGAAASMEQPWLDDAPEYLSSMKVLEIPSVLENIKSLPNLSKLLKPGGSIRYMRKVGGRCRVHVADLMRYCQDRAKAGESPEDDDLYVRGFEEGLQQGQAKPLRGKPPKA